MKLKNLTEAERYRILMSWLADDELVGLVMSSDDKDIREFKGCNKCIKVMLKKED